MILTQTHPIIAIRALPQRIKAAAEALYEWLVCAIGEHLD